MSDVTHNEIRVVFHISQIASLLNLTQQADRSIHIHDRFKCIKQNMVKERRNWIQTRHSVPLMLTIFIVGLLLTSTDRNNNFVKRMINESRLWQRL